jgi:transcriptional regulator with XRE-family HTH domain
VSRLKAAALSLAEPPSRGRRTGQADAQLGVRIRVARTEAGLSQEELATRIGISCQQLQKYEVAANRVTVARLIDISDALGLDVTRLLSDTGVGLASGDSKLQDVDILRLIQSFCSIRNPASRLKLIELAEFIAKLESTPRVET